MWWDHAGHMGWMWLWWLVGLAFLLVVIWAAVRAAAPQPPAADKESPEVILKRRYASGELNRDEYQRRLEELRM